MLTLKWGFKFAFGFDVDDGFFLYTFPQEDEGSEFFIRADLSVDNLNIDAKLLYFLNVALNDALIQFGAGIFVDIDKEAGKSFLKSEQAKMPKNKITDFCCFSATRKSDTQNSVRYGRLSRSDLKKIPVKKDLFQICLKAAAILEVSSASLSLDIPIPELEEVEAWLPSLNVGGISAVVKKEISSSSGSRRLNEIDVARLKNSVSPDSHRGLRMLCANDGSFPDDVDCPVDTNSGEFACAKMKEVRLDIEKIQGLVEPILEKFVNSGNDGFFDQVAVPLLELDKPLPGVSEISGKATTFLDVAEIYYPDSGVKTARVLLEIYRVSFSILDFSVLINIINFKSLILFCSTVNENNGKIV